MAAPTLNFFYKNNTLSTVQTDNDHHVIVSANAHNLSETTRLEARLLATDVQQSTVTVASENRTTFAYGPYGHDDRHSDARVISRFTGQPWLPSAVGYMLGNGHRLFSPAMMRFYSADSLSPFGKGGLNAYAYCNNDPINRSDPSGRYPSILKWRKGGYAYKNLSPKLSEDFSSFSSNEYQALGKSLDKRLSKTRRRLKAAVTQGDETTIRQLNTQIETLDTQKLTYKLYTLKRSENGPRQRYVRDVSTLTQELLGGIAPRYGEPGELAKNLLSVQPTTQISGITEDLEYEDMVARLERLRHG